MHREGYIMQEITSYGNMSEAFDRVLRGTKRKRCRQGRYLLAHREEVIAELTAKLADGSFRLGNYHERIICENGKVRHLQIISMYDRIAVYAVMNVVDQHLHKRFIRTTGASIKKRGTHDLRKCMQLDMERDPEGTRYCYEFDIKHFYDNTKPDLSCGATAEYSKTKSCCRSWIIFFIFCRRVSVSGCEANRLLATSCCPSTLTII